MSDETTIYDVEENGLLLVSGLQAVASIATAALWMESIVPAVVPALFGASAVALFVLSTLESENVYEEKASVSETPDEDPRDDETDASIRPGESVSNEQLQAIADEHDIDVVGVDPTTEDESDE